MNWRVFFGMLFSVFFILIATTLLILYWFVPTRNIEFQFSPPKNTNFSLSNSKTEAMQFYPNMRFSDSRISYKIDNCSLQKKNDMEQAFETIENKTVLKFYEVAGDEDTFVTCDSKNKVEGGLFIAGEGGPTNITQTDLFNVILHGKILLIRQSDCPKPNVAIHELLHVLGFDHSENPNNIMYAVTNCDQIIGDDTINLINDLYSVPSYPDLSFINASANVRGRYMDADVSIKNHGLEDSSETKLLIYADNTILKTLDLEPIGVGYGRTIRLKNIWVSERNVEKIKLVIDSFFNEINKNNNELVLNIREG